jgi:ABC-type sugar transport system permease subunit
MRQALTRPKKSSRTDKWLPFWLIAPTIVVLLIVQVYPALYTAWLSVHEREPGGWVAVGFLTPACSKSRWDTPSSFLSATCS